MKIIKALFFSTFLWVSFLTAQVNPAYNDGPYIFDQEDNIRIRWIEGGVGHDTLIAKDVLGVFRRDGLPTIDLTDLDFEKNNQATYDKVDDIVAISDAHGQYDIMIDLLKAHRVIDEQNQWTFGKGHLVITGDNLDRGDKVMEILWFLFFLEKQAAEAGGKVHVLLGNHEVMVLQGDIRYLNRKYLYTSGVLKNRYHLMFAEGATLYHENGPLWYRGYFRPEGMENFPIDKILKKLDQDRIVVGHTSFDKIRSFYNGKVLGIDCGIAIGRNGQVLVYENERFFVGELDGTKGSITLNSTVKPVKTRNLK